MSVWRAWRAPSRIPEDQLSRGKQIGHSKALTQRVPPYTTLHNPKLFGHYMGTIFETFWDFFKTYCISHHLQIFLIQMNFND